MEMVRGHLTLLRALKQLRFLVDTKSMMARNVITDKFIQGTLVVLVFTVLQLRQLRFLLIMHIPLILVPFIMEI